MRRESVFFRSQIIAHGFLIIVAVLIDSPIVIVNQKLHRIRANPVVVIPVCNAYQRIIIGIHIIFIECRGIQKSVFCPRAAPQNPVGVNVLDDAQRAVRFDA